MRNTESKFRICNKGNILMALGSDVDDDDDDVEMNAPAETDFE